MGDEKLWFSEDILLLVQNKQKTSPVGTEHTNSGNLYHLS